ncbi:SLATT domain-containing protein [Jiella sonneratiae]|uniref:DUF4231 domain-containing protein n=1 Tax=Jiella sonneratiae TaxID=2816856 RepID=A0ABS3JBL0_9HYPH|nr:DUF4231 domain-containing protein [Jiella sonneratiae]MBO0906532.1 DUF4231 domain-containing protein [Jiella sonneratiae]
MEHEAEDASGSVKRVGRRSEEPILEKWAKREEKLNDEVTAAIRDYLEEMEFARKGSRFTNVLIMILSSIAPLFVVSTAAAPSFQGFTGISQNIIGLITLIITVALSLAEGFRRIFRFDQRWATCYVAKRALKNAREKYRISQVPHQIGSDEWVANFVGFRGYYESMIDREVKEFFDALQADVGGQKDV